MDHNLIKRASNSIERLYSAPLMSALLLAAFGFFWLFNFSSLPVSNPELVRISRGEGLLDLRLFYSAREAYGALTRYGPAGRHFYHGFLIADFIFIPVYSLGFSMLMTRTIRAVCGKGGSRLSALNLLPVSIGLFDCAENLCILGMLRIYPGSSMILGTLSGIATSCKWLLTFAAVSSLVYGGIVLLIRRAGFRICTVRRQ